MSADKLASTVDQPPAEIKSDQDAQQVSQSPATANAQMTQRTGPGRKPLFRH